jgi:4-hydroxy-tetrahydrodipicolinate reductase
MKIVISGYGRMGKEIFSLLQEKGNVTLFVTDDIRGIDSKTASGSVCIDFTTPEAFRRNYRFIADSFRAAVIGTTGWNDIKEEVTGYFMERGTTMIYASNFSVGVNIFFEIARISSALLASSGDYDPYITEYHHKYKVDAPSGTAGTLRQIVEKETGKECTVQSVRAGNIPGIHNLGFESANDRIVMTHEAFSRRGFASGAVQAAYWTLERKGVFEFREILVEKFNRVLYNERD